MCNHLYGCCVFGSGVTTMGPGGAMAAPIHTMGPTHLTFDCAPFIAMPSSCPPPPPPVEDLGTLWPPI